MSDWGWKVLGAAEAILQQAEHEKKMRENQMLAANQANRRLAERNQTPWASRHLPGASTELYGLAQDLASELKKRSNPLDATVEGLLERVRRLNDE